MLKELACLLTPAADQQASVRRGTELAERRYFAGDPGGARRELERPGDRVALDYFRDGRSGSATVALEAQP